MNLIHRLFKERKGEIATILALVGVVVMVIGIVAGGKLVEVGTRFLPRASTDIDCPSDWTIANGQCINPHPEPQCPAGYESEDGVCTPLGRPNTTPSDDEEPPPTNPPTSGSPCENDSHCGADLVCVSSICIPPNTTPSFPPSPTVVPCGTDSECGIGKKCRNGRCISAPGACTVSVDCGWGLICVSGTCLDPTPAIPIPTNTPIPGSPTNTPIPGLPTNTPVPVSPTNTPVPVSCVRKPQGDANSDGKVDILDYSIWLNSQCNTKGACGSLKADFDCDGLVNDTDFKIWFDNKFK